MKKTTTVMSYIEMKKILLLYQGVVSPQGLYRRHKYHQEMKQSSK